MNTLLHFLVC